MRRDIAQAVCVFAFATGTWPAEGAEPSPSAAEGAEGLTLQRALQTGLENSPAFEILDREVERARAAVLQRRGPFAPQLSADASLSYEETLPDLFLPNQTQRIGSLGVVFEHLLPTGTRYRAGLDVQVVSFDIPQVVLDAEQANFDVAHTGSLFVGVRQSLLRGAFLRPNRAPIEAAQVRVASQRAQRRTETIRQISGMEEAYWQLRLALDELEIRRVNRELAAQQVADAEKRLAAGSSSPLDVIEARTELHRVERDVTLAEQNVATRRGLLLERLLVPDPARAEWDRVEPSNAPELEGPRLEDELLVRAAWQNRPELEAAKAERDALALELQAAKNGLLPRLDVEGELRVSGFSGALLFRSNDEPPAGLDPGLNGEFFDLFGNLSFPSARIGGRFEVPLDNVEAIGRRDAARARLARAEARISELRRLIREQVLARRRAFDHAVERLRRARRLEQTAREFAEGQQRRFRGGAGVTFDVLRANTALVAAQLETRRIQVEARLLLNELRIALGDYLDVRSIELSKG